MPSRHEEEPARGSDDEVDLRRINERLVISGLREQELAETAEREPEGFRRPASHDAEPAPTARPAKASLNEPFAASGASGPALWRCRVGGGEQSGRRVGWEGASTVPRERRATRVPVGSRRMAPDVAASVEHDAHVRVDAHLGRRSKRGRSRNGHEESSADGNGASMRDPVRHCGHRRDAVTGLDEMSGGEPSKALGSSSDVDERAASCAREAASLVSTWLDAYRP